MDHEWQQVEREYLAGVKLAKIAAQFNVDRKLILFRARTHGWHYGDEKLTVDQALRSGAYNGDDSEPKLIEETELDNAIKETVAQVTRSQPHDDRGPEAVIDWDLAKQVYSAGLSFWDVAEALDVDPRTLGERAYHGRWELDLSQVLREHGLPEYGQAWRHAFAKFRERTEKIIAGLDNDDEELKLGHGDDLKLVDRILAALDSESTDAPETERHAGHKCDACGAPVERPVYCGRRCQQRAYRKRKKES